MGQAIGNVLSLAIGVAISPIPIVAVVLMLATPRGKVNGDLHALGSRSKHVLGELRTWMIHNNQVIMAVLCLIIGVKLIGDAIGGFTS